MKKKIYLFILVLSITLSYDAQIKPNKSALDKDWEIWQEKVPISGNVRVGFMLESTKKDPEYFYASIPENVSIPTNLCIEISSKDGRYSAKIDYPITESNLGKNIWLYLPTEHKNDLTKYKTDELIILGALTNDCKKPNIYVVCSWDNPEANNTKSVHFYANSATNSTLFIKKRDSSEVSYSCEVLNEPTVAYNRKCTIPRESIKDLASIFLRNKTKRGPRKIIVDYRLPLVEKTK